MDRPMPRMYCTTPHREMVPIASRRAGGRENKKSPVILWPTHTRIHQGMVGWEISLLRMGLLFIQQLGRGEEQQKSLFFFGPLPRHPPSPNKTLLLLLLPILFFICQISSTFTHKFPTIYFLYLLILLV